MKILMGSDKLGKELKEEIKAYLQLKGIEVIDKTTVETDAVDAAEAVCKGILAGEGDRGILIDEFGMASFMAANKHKGIICAAVSDEHSAYMTIGHNNTAIITLGSGIVGKSMAKNIVDAYLGANYDGGRHQVRVDMLNKML